MNVLNSINHFLSRINSFIIAKLQIRGSWCFYFQFHSSHNFSYAFNFFFYIFFKMLANSDKDGCHGNDVSQYSWYKIINTRQKRIFSICFGSYILYLKFKLWIRYGLLKLFMSFSYIELSLSPFFALPVRISC